MIDIDEIKALPRAKYYDEMVQDMFKEMGSPEASRIHAGLGISGECGELLLALNNYDLENAAEEGGDAMFYLQKLMNMHGFTFEGLAVLAPQHDVVFSEIEGLIYEAAGLLDVLKKSWVYGKALDEDELAASLSRLVMYLELAVAPFDLTLEDLRACNQWKLVTGPKARYPSGKYSDAAALARADKQPDA